MRVNIEQIYYCFILISLFAGAFFVKNAFFVSRGKAVAGYQVSMKRSMDRLMRSLKDSAADEIFLRSGVNLSLQKYKAVRQVLVALVFCWAGLSVLKGDLNQAIKVLLFGAAGYAISHPKEYVGKRKTPFKLIFDAMYRKRQEKRDEELMAVIMQMKNLILSQNCRAVSADYILSRLLRFTNLSKQIFIHALALIRQGRSEAAGAYFEASFGTRLGKGFAQIILKLDHLPPTEFLEQLTLFQLTAREEQQTKKERKQENIKMLMTTLSALEGMVIIGNFVYLVLVDTLVQMNF